jgi:hypothetical protein
MPKLKPRIYNRHHGNAPTDAVYVGRGSPWGNPYKIGEHGTRDEVCNLFEDNVLPHLDVSVLTGKSLICFCYPQRCHAEALLKKANS